MSAGSRCRGRRDRDQAHGRPGDRLAQATRQLRRVIAPLGQRQVRRAARSQIGYLDHPASGRPENDAHAGDSRVVACLSANPQPRLLGDWASCGASSRFSALQSQITSVSKTVVRLIGVPRVRISPPPFSPGVRSLFETRSGSTLADPHPAVVGQGLAAALRS
jgi:hypothetical protein